MDICIDVQSAITQRAGVGRYTRELVHNLDACLNNDRLRLVYFDFKRKAAALNAPHAQTTRIGWCPGRLAQLAWKKTGWPPFDAFAGSADVYHFPNFTLPPLRRGKAVVTVHDLSFVRYPQFTEQGNLEHLNARLRPSVEKADAIIAVSQFSADELVELLDIDTNRVTAVLNGIDPSLTAPPQADIDAMRTQLGLDRPYLLTVGTLEPRKNYPFLFDVFDRLKGFDGDLVIAGMPGWKYGPIIERLHGSPRAARIKWQRYVKDMYLPALYAGAEAFVFTSHYEGFGFPPLEAMACGTPVISSSGGSLAEILGSAAVVLDTFDIDAWAGAVQEVLESTAAHTRLVGAGLAHVKSFTWQRAAQETMNVYRKVCG